LRRSAANAASPIRKHARIDLGYVSDIAETYDSHDADELDGEGVEYAPFDTQMQYGQMDEIPSEIPDCQNIGILNDPEPEYNGHYAHLASHIETVRFSPLVNAACIAEHESGSKCGSVFVEQARDYWTELFHMSLCSMPERVVKELTSGNLKQAYDSDANLRQTLDSFEERAKSHPCIYVRSLTASAGQPMTTDQAKRFVKWLQRYVSNDLTIRRSKSTASAKRRSNELTPSLAASGSVPALSLHVHTSVRGQVPAWNAVSITCGFFASNSSQNARGEAPRTYP
jgi:hypothetical protein